MTRLGLRPYPGTGEPAPGSVPVTVLVLSRDEEANIGRCLASVAWARQVIVVDSGSADATVALARDAGADVIEQPWLGFAAQREFAVRHPAVRHDWVYFVDADEWVSDQLAAEIAQVLAGPPPALLAGPPPAVLTGPPPAVLTGPPPAVACAAYAQRFRLVFQGRWIRHCGWYRGSWIVRLMDRRRARFGAALVGERATVDGPVGRLRHDIVDEDRKGLAAWLHKHVEYAAMEARQRGRRPAAAARLRSLRARSDTRPLARAVLKDVVFPAVPAKPAAMFGYMYLLRLGFLDGLPGLRFCFYHAWYQACVGALRAAPRAAAEPAASR